MRIASFSNFTSLLEYCLAASNNAPPGITVKYMAEAIYGAQGKIDNPKKENIQKWCLQIIEMSDEDLEKHLLLL